MNYLHVFFVLLPPFLQKNPKFARGKKAQISPGPKDLDA